jgi:hypothetical protein
LHLGRSVDQRERWQALQQHLKSARAAMEAGQRADALKHADAALALDPAFLAAQTLRERIVAMSGVSVAAAIPAPAVAVAEAAPVGSVAVKPLPRSDPAPPRRQGADLSQFEARARQRRLERRVAAAHESLSAGTLVDARAAIDEIKELDPAHPALLSLVEALDAAERLRIVTVVDRELPMRPLDEAPERPFVAPVTSDLPLIAADATPELAGSQASDVSTDAVVVPVLIPPSQVRPEIQASTDQAVVPIQPVAPSIASSHVAPPPRRRSRVLPWLAAAAAFAGVVYAAPWLQRFVPSDRGSAPPPVEVAVIAPTVVPTTGADAAPIEMTPLVDAGAPSPDRGAGPDASRTVTPQPGPAATNNAAANEPAVSSTVAPLGTARADTPVLAAAATTPRPAPAAPTPAPAETVASVLPPVAPPAAPPQPRAEPSPSFGISPDIPPQLAAAPIPAPPAARPPATAAANVPARPDDLQQVRAVLQQYRSAYQDLSAERARAIWPDVNEAALQRAFQALESQTLTFEGCDVQLRGSNATATCHGTTQYVPKFGSREPRVESRVWNFTLQKTGETWQIASARTQR